MNLKHNSLNIFFKNEKYNKLSNSLNILWNGYSNSNNKLSLISYIEKNDNIFKNLYLEYLYELKKNILNEKHPISNLLINKRFHLWWMSKIEEKSFYKQSQIYECIKVIALKKIIEKNNFKEINLFNADNEVKIFIRELAKEKDIIFNSINDTSKFNPYNIKVVRVLRSLFNFLRFIYDRRLLIFRKKTKIKLNYKIVLFDFFNYYDLNSLKKNKIYKSIYWRSLTKNLFQNKIPILWVHTFYKNNDIKNINIASKLLSEANNHYQNNILLDSFINLSVITRTLIIYIKSAILFLITRNKKKLFYVKSLNLNLWHLLKNDFHDAFYGPDLIINTFYFYLYEKCMSKINKNSNGFFICENQSIEKCLVFNWNNKTKKNIYGIQNSTVRYWDLRYSEFKDKSFLDKKFHGVLYSKLLLNGQLSENVINTNEYYKKYIGKIEAFRYENIKNINFNKNKLLNKIHYKILIIGDSSDLINTNLLNYFNNYLYSNNKIKFYFKPHPLSNIHLKSKYSDFFIEKENITDCLEKYNYFVTSNATSASLELYLLNANLFVMLDNHILNLSPIRNLEGSIFFSDKDNFFDLMNKKKNIHSNLLFNSLYYSSKYQLFMKYIND